MTNVLRDFNTHMPWQWYYENSTCLHLKFFGVETLLLFRIRFRRLRSRTIISYKKIIYVTISTFQYSAFWSGTIPLAYTYLSSFICTPPAAFWNSPIFALSPTASVPIVLTHHYSVTCNSVFKSFSRFQTAHKTLPFDLGVLPPPPSRGCIPLLSAVAVRTLAVSFSFACFYFLHCTTQICFLCLPYDQSQLLTWRMNLSIKFRSTAIFFVFSSV